jgi:hypothetical protein
MIFIYLACCYVITGSIDSTSMIPDAISYMLIIHGLVLLIYSLVNFWCKLLKKVVCSTFDFSLHIFVKGIKLVTNCILLPTEKTYFWNNNVRLKHNSSLNIWTEKVWFNRNSWLVWIKRAAREILPPTIAQTLVKKCKNDLWCSVNVTCERHGCQIIVILLMPCKNINVKCMNQNQKTFFWISLCHLYTNKNKKRSHTDE